MQEILSNSVRTQFSRKTTEAWWGGGTKKGPEAPYVDRQGDNPRPAVGEDLLARLPQPLHDRRHRLRQGLLLLPLALLPGTAPVLVLGHFAAPLLLRQFAVNPHKDWNFTRIGIPTTWGMGKRCDLGATRGQRNRARHSCRVCVLISMQNSEE